MEFSDPLQVVRQVRTPLGQPPGERVMLKVQGVSDVIDTRQHGAEELPIVDHAAHRDAAETHSVVALLAADQTLSGALAFHAVVGDGDLERRVH